MKVQVESVLPLHPITVNHHVFINYTLINKDSTHQPHPLKLHYTIQADSAQWNIGTKRGVVEAPGVGQTVTFRVTGTPKIQGHLTTPTCTFVAEKLSEGGESVKCDSEKFTLTNAQFYDTTQQQYVTVAESGSGGRPF